MRGLPKRFGTAEDIRNCYAMVQAGELDAEELLEAIEEWEAQGFACCPVVETNNKTIALVYCPEISAGDTVIVGDSELKIKTVTHVQDEEGQPEKTLLLFSTTPPESEFVKRILSPTVYEQLDITKEEIDQIKEALHG